MDPGVRIMITTGIRIKEGLLMAGKHYGRKTSSTFTEDSKCFSNIAYKFFWVLDKLPDIQTHLTFRLGYRYC